MTTLTIQPVPEKTVNTAFRYTQTAVKVNAEWERQLSYIKTTK